MADVRITEFSDPGCPWAYSAEPSRLRLTWLYGDHLEWRVNMVGLAESPDEYAEKGFTPERQSAAFSRISGEHLMPIDTRVRRRMAATLPACRAVVAARLHEPDRERALLRRLRVRHFSGQLLDDPDTIDGAAREAAVAPDELHAWLADPEVEATLREDLRRAREPMPAALVLEHKLASWSGGLRYTCPSYEIERRSDGVRLAIPGFQPFAAYEVVLANLIPNAARRESPESVEEALRWAGFPLSSQEVAVLRDIPLPQAREELARVATEQPVGTDGFWTLPGVPVAA